MMRRWKAAVTGAVLIAAVALAGCAAGGVTYQKAVPAALEKAGIGMTDVSASRQIDGFTGYLSVIGTIDRAELSPHDLSTALRVIVDANDLGVGQLRLTVYDADHRFIPLTEIARELDASIPKRHDDTELVISMDDARRLGKISEQDAGE